MNDEKKPFEVHVYRLGMGPVPAWFDTQEFAVNYAKNCFENPGVYKVKVWDLTKGEPQPNLVNAPGLILHLV